MNKSIITYAIMLTLPSVYAQAEGGCRAIGIAAGQSAVQTAIVADTTRTGNIPRQLFKINESTLEQSPALDYICSAVDSLGSSGRLLEVKINGFASPDGPAEFNERLARSRSDSMRSYLLSHCDIQSSNISISSVGEDWAGLRDAVSADENLPRREEILRILDSEPDTDARERRIRELGRDSWRYLSENIFPGLRRVVVRVVGENSVETITIASDTGNYHTEIEAVAEPEPVVELPVEPEVQEVAEAELIAPSCNSWGLTLKTNVVAWLMGVSNIEAELQAGRHFSVMIPIYYSGWNYFRSDLKYRTFSILPEARYWVKGYGEGFFADIHGGFSYYNVALCGEYRYQDRDGKTPALGGGIGVGYRFNFCRDRAWQMEISVGAGIYTLDYDMFINKPNGLLAKSNRRVFYGIDNAALSFCYTFDLNRKKGGSR